MLARAAQEFRSGAAVNVRLFLSAAAVLVSGCQTLPQRSPSLLHNLDFSALAWQEISADPMLQRAGDPESCWPVYAALRADAPAGYDDCNSAANPLACMAQARQQGRVAALVQLGAGDDSMAGWAAIQRRDGRFVLYGYDSSPCGGWLPSACGYSLHRAECDVLSPPQADPARQLALCDKPYFGVKQQ